MLPQEEEQEFQTLLQLFKADPALQNELSRVSYEDLFSDAFMAEYSQFSSLDDLLFRGGFGIMNLMEVENIPPERWDAYIAKYTPYSEWHDFGKKAMVFWMKNVLAALEQEKAPQ